MPPKKAAPSSAATPVVATPAAGVKGAANEVGIEVTVKLIKSKTDVYRGLYIRLIGQGIECANSQVCPLVFSSYVSSSVTECITCDE